MIFHIYEEESLSNFKNSARKGKSYYLAPGFTEKAEYFERSNKRDVFKLTYKTNAYFKRINKLGDFEDRSANKYLSELKRKLHRN